MKKNALIFLLTFVVGAGAALIYRSARYQPYAEPEAPKMEQPTPEASMEHSGHAAATVNSVCPICGMDVDPSIAPANYKGQKVGFGCAACPARFAKDPERWGPSALKNVVAE